MAIQLNYGIFNSNINYLTAQPFTYDETDVLRGITARKWQISGLVKPSEWLNILNLYNEWRNARILDENPEISGVIGTTINFSGTGPGGISWTNIECWFTSTPQGEANGEYISLNVEIIDANQKLQEILKVKEDAYVTADLPDYGTITISNTTLILRKPLDSYGEGPKLELTAAGHIYTSGPLVVYKIKDIQGETDLAGWNDITEWYESMIVTSPVIGSYYPISIPTATAERRIIEGVTTDIWTVSIQLGMVI